MAFKVEITELSNLPNLKSTGVAVTEYAGIGTKTTKVVVVDGTNIGFSQVTISTNEAKAAAAAAKVSEQNAAATLANAVQKTGAQTMAGPLVIDGKLTTKSQLEVIDSTGVYGQRFVNASGLNYLQAGKMDRDVADQKLMLSGWYGTPLSSLRFSLSNGTHPQVSWGSSSYDILHRGNMPTPEEIKAMAIYDRPTGDDCNNAILPGNYGIFANTANTPYGTGPSGSTLLVTRWGNGSSTQIFFTYTQDRVFVRRMYIGVWQDWFELYSTKNKQPVGGMGLGVGDSPNAITVTGGVRDFNLIKTTGVFTVDGNWSNGIDNTASATTHTGIVEVKQRAFDNLTHQKFTNWVTVAGFVEPREFTRIWINATEGWGPWIATGVWESVNTYRSGILRHNNSTNDDSVYPYVSYAKEKYRDGVAAGVPYTIGEVSFRVGTANRYDPHSGDQLSRILGQATNTATSGEYEGSLFLASRRKAPDGSIGDSSTLRLSRDIGAEFTHAGKKVQIETGNVNAEKFVVTTSGYALQYSANTQQGIYFDNRTIVGGGSSGIVIRPNGTGTTSGETVFGSDGTILNSFVPTTGSHLTNKTYVDKTISGSLSSIIPLKDADDLDNIKTAGFYSQVANAKATLANHYPVEKAGNLIVTTSAGTIQKYWVYNSSEVWSRAQYSSGAWKPWYRDYNEEFKPTAADVGTMTTAQINTELGKKLNLSGGTMTGAIIVGNMKSAIKVDNQKSMSFQDQSSTMYHLLSEGNNFKIKHGNNAENPLFDISSSSIAANTPMYSRNAMIVQDTAGTKWLGLEIPAGANPYISVRAVNDTQNRIALTFTKGEILSNTDTVAAIAFRVSSNGGLKFSPDANLSGRTWATGMDPATGDLGFHRYTNGVWIDQPFRFEGAGGGTLINTLTVYGNTNIGGSLNIDSGYLRLNKVGNNILEFHNPGTTAAMIYMQPSTGQMRFGTSNGSGGETFLRMAIETNGTVTCTALVQTSDRRLKTDIEELSDCLEKNSKLVPSTYHKDGFDDNVREVGLMAQDVQEVLPEAVIESSEGVLGVNYAGVTTLNTGAINELYKLVQELQEEIRILKSK
ncbi:pyocin knob domain-containing S74 family peptidase [Aeromonas hydrophila]|uniref:pyocin knob domain-containing S74 family peptidase n=1 Tax=Aeromonas hydrophila TaxID=644 RepID=UPI002360E81C|nr:pyocin knob domain-containing S74 family peptidase [Aeromonas hydrophila]